MSFRLIAGSALWQLASQVTMAGLSILTVKFVAIGLTKELAGNYNSAYGYLQLFGILADFGLYAIAVNEVSRASNRERVLGALIVLRAIILALSLIGGLAIAWTITMWRGTPLPLGITIAALVPFFTLLAGILRTIFQVEYKMHFVFIAEVTQRIITAALIGFFIYLGVRGSNDLHIYHLFLFIGGIGAFVLFFISFIAGNRLVKIKPRWDPELIGSLAKKALPYGLAFLCMAVYRQFDVTLIALLRPDFELQNAYYGFVVRMTDMGFLIPTFLLNSVLPLLHRDETRAKAMLSKVLFIILILGSISMLFALLWARPLIALLTTEAYLSTSTRLGSDVALMVLSIPLFLNGIILFGFYTLLTKHAWQKLIYTMAIGAVVSIGINLVLIPLYGFVGAAMTSVVVHIILAMLFWRHAKREIHITLPAGFLLRWGSFTILLGLVLMTIRPFLVSEIATIVGLGVGTVAILFISWTNGIIRMLLLSDSKSQ